ncbi:transglutaminase-like cysteine proteinase BTLCP [Andreprevotia lacus DSM 23236]|uniref:Transglutaminase-like cysteine proteinase BTLCP n=2 Tax=Andreprevotia TaxID=397275 RepID=A0A1W1Y0S5_9NEIS|nr:transglutaminase-like cysteine proteinase BTLCP [Andreprevotia lacus DSM 23236]
MDSSSKPLLRFVFCLALFLGFFAWPVQSALNVDRFRQMLTKRFGEGPLKSFQEWQVLINAGKNWSESDKLKRTNEFFNRRLTFADDMTVWKQQDYWATPMETIGMNAGDCEDFAIVKYYTLKEMGITEDKLRLIYVKARIGGADSTVTQAHMVLAFYQAPDAEPLILDNLITDIRPASRRSDLQPVFSFNATGVFTGGSQATASIDRLSRWKDLLLRAQDEGFSP